MHYACRYALASAMLAGCQSNGISTFLHPKSSPAVKVLHMCFKVMGDVADAFWAPLRSDGRLVAGAQRQAFAVCLALIGNRWLRFARRVEHRWQWLLGRMVHPLTTPSERESIGRRFIASKLCCLDPAFSEALIEWLDAWLLGRRWRILTLSCLLHYHGNQGF